MSLILSAITLQAVFIYIKPFTLIAKGGSTNVLEMGGSAWWEYVPRFITLPGISLSTVKKGYFRSSS